MSNVPEPALKQHEPVRRAWWKRWRIPFVLLVMALAVVGWWHWAKSQEEQRLQAVYALWDQQGRWRWNDWLVDRPVVTDKENGDIIISQMAKLIPGNLETDLGMLLMNDVNHYSPNHVLHSEQTLELRRRIQKCEEAFKLFPEYLKRKHALSRIPQGVSPYTIVLLNIQESRSLHNRLEEQMEVELSEGKTAQAQQTILMSLQLAHYLDEQLMLIGRLVQVALLSRNCNQVQRWLALSEPDDQLLAAMQAALAPFDTQSFFRKSILIEAGAFDQTVLDMKKNKSNLSSLMAWGGNANTWWEKTWESMLSIIQAQRLGSPAQHAECLEIYLMLYLQTWERWSMQRKGWQELDASLKQSKARAYLPDMKHYLLPAMEKVGMAEMKLAAQFRVTQVALAAERYRRVHQHWPQSQEELLKGFLPSIQLDPYDDQPIRIKPVEDGILIYSIGKDNVDDGGDVLEARERVGTVTDVGIKLWKVNQRRLPALPLSNEYLEKKAELQRTQGGEEKK
ncbi:MAG TPA: hypothetical protein PLN21_05555 [Gemmatales bacterium]|nr:hypothetical protein [Gemmatales bacterium]